MNFRLLHVLVVLLLMGGFTLNGQAGQLLFLDNATFSCNDLVHVSLGNNCEGLITIDEILEDDNGLDPADFTIEITGTNGATVGNPVNGNYIGEILTVTVTEIATDNSCCGTILIEDKFPPNVVCTSVAVECFESADSAPLPIASDNCDPNPTLYLVDEITNNDDICNGVTIVRTYLAEDTNGNTSNACQQTITFNPPPPVTFPSPISLDCAAVFANSVANATKASFLATKSVSQFTQIR